MAFRLVKDPMDTHAELLEIASITVVVGDLLELQAAGATESWILCTSSSEFWTPKAVAQEAASSSATEVLAIRVHPLQEWDVDVANDSNTTHNNQLMVLTDENTVNNTGTDSTANTAVFRQRSAVGATGNRRVVGNFAVGHGIDIPAAS